MKGRGGGVRRAEDDGRPGCAVTAAVPGRGGPDRAPGRALEHLPAVAAGVRRRGGDRRAGGGDRPGHAAETLAAAAAQDVDLGEVEPRWPSGGHAAASAAGGVVHRYLAPAGPRRARAGSDRGAALTHRQARRWQHHRPVRARRRGWGEVAGGAGVLVQAAGPQGIPAPGPSSWPTPWCSWPTTPSPPGRLPFLRTVKPHVIVTIGVEDLADPATGPAAAETGFGAQDLRRPRPVAGLRRRSSPGW